MENTFDIKFWLAITASVLDVIAFFPYIRDIFLRKTKPHAYTWLIWSITQSTAVVALWYGGGGFGAISLSIGVLVSVFVFILSLKYGTTNIKTSDTVVLIFALAAILVWWQLSSLLLAVLMVSAIDGIGYVPTYRKSFANPWTESLAFWFIMIGAGAMTIMASKEYNLLTMTYLVTLVTSDIILLSLLLIRRRQLGKKA